MAIQHRRGVYNKFDPSKLLPGEWAVVLSGDPDVADGRAVYICFAAGDVKRLTTYEDMNDIILRAEEAIVASLTAGCDAATGAADAATAAAKASTERALASADAADASKAAADSATTQANSAASFANAQGASAQTAAGRANSAADRVELLEDSGVSWEQLSESCRERVASCASYGAVLSDAEDLDLGWRQLVEPAIFSTAPQGLTASELEWCVAFVVTGRG